MGGVVIDSGKFDWAKSGKFKSLAGPEPAYHGLRFHETFGDLRPSPCMARPWACATSAATLAPMNAFLTITGIETLPLRMERHVANALGVAQFLERHAAVSWVSYAGLAASPYRSAATEIHAARARARSSPSA